MATTTLLQRHAGEGETIAEAIRDCLDYGKDPEKTESGKYISAYECDPATVADEFLLAKASYAAMTGREQKKENNVLCYQIRQSFYPGEITPKEANRIGYELAMRWTKGRHAFIVTTHTDKQHIHCHIYYNSTTLDCTRKFRNFWGSSFALRRLSDRLCLENGLSIVENPKPRSKGKYRNYGEWQKDRKGPLSYQDRLRLAIDTALAERPADLDEFLNLMKRAGYEVKTVRGGGISFRLTGQGQERFTRLRASTLGDGYDLQDVLSAIEGKEKRPGRSERKISLAVDIQAKLAAGKGPGYERWAKVFNIKQMAAALAYIQDNGLTDYEQLAQKATEAADRFHTISEQIKQTEQAMKTNAGLKAATVQYAKTRPVFEQYKATKYSRKFLAEHEADLELYRAAQAEMRSLLGGAKLPKMDVLKEEGRKLTAKKKQLYPGQCDGQSGYGVTTLDAVVESIVCMKFEEILECSKSNLLEEMRRKDLDAAKKEATRWKEEVQTKVDEQDALKKEMIRVIQGTSGLDREMIQQMVNENKEALLTAQTNLADSEKKLKEIEEQNQKAERNCSDLFTWASTYKGASFERRQAILKQFIKEVRVGRDYNIEIVLNVPLDEFEEFKRHAASAGRGKNQKNKSQNPQKVGRCTSNAGIVVLDKTAGETISIVPKNAAHAILRC